MRFKNKQLPSSLSEANICVSLKKDKDETDPSSYRSIALLNYDLKIKSSSKPARKKCSKYHSSTGFILGRYSFCSDCKILEIIYADYGKIDRAAILYLDTCKAFHMIEWPYLFATLKKFEFGNTFMEWAKILYSNPKSSILTNGDRSGLFTLQCGVCQGDPLPSAIQYSAEPLAIGIRGHPLSQAVLRPV